MGRCWTWRYQYCRGQSRYAAMALNESWTSPPWPLTETAGTGGVAGSTSFSTMARGASARSSSRKRDGRQDRKSTRLNSSHTVISYAVFCLKKKKNHKENDKWHQ